VSGLKARGGFEVSLSWNDGMLAQATLRSGLGGNARVRSHRPLHRVDGQPLAKAEGDNPNPLYFTPPVHDVGEAKSIVIDTFVYDVPTKAGDIVVLAADAN
jgi:alpha-L-fucosidase 2